MCGNTRARTCEIGQNMITRYHENGPTFGEDFRHVSLISRYPWDIPGPSNSLNISVVLHHQAFHQIYGRIERFPKKLGVVYHGCVSHRHGHPPSLLTSIFVSNYGAAHPSRLLFNCALPKLFKFTRFSDLRAFAGFCGRFAGNFGRSYVHLNVLVPGI